MLTVRRFSAALVALTLASCGGGGGSSPPPPPPSAAVPTITAQPAAVTVAEGAAINLSVMATGNGTLSYSWRLGGTPIVGATGASYAVATATPANAGNYDVVVTNTLNGTTASATSTAAAVGVVPFPVITTQPVSATTLPSVPVRFTVQATGTGTVTYEWRENGVNINNQSATLQFNYPQAGTRTYDVVVTNTVGGVSASVVSDTVTLICMEPPTRRFIAAEPVVQQGTSGHFATTLNEAGLTYTWSVTNGTITSGQGTSAITYTAGAQPGALRIVVSVANPVVSRESVHDARIVPAVPQARIFAQPIVHPGDPYILASATGVSLPGQTYFWGISNVGPVLPGMDLGSQSMKYIAVSPTAYQLNVTINPGATQSTDLRALSVATDLFLKDKRDPAPRTMHTATLLNDGRVLLVGGDAGVPEFDSAMYNAGPRSRVVGTAELWDPITTHFAPVPSIAARAGHSATLLNDGRVLVVGGASPGNAYLASGSIYNPVTLTWSAAGSLAEARKFHTATLLNDGRVLVAGGFNGSGSRASAEIYDPGTNAWTPTGSMTMGRYSHSATALPDGRVLVAAGATSNYTAELFDPASGTWTATPNMDTNSLNRSRHGAVYLPSGRVLQLGFPLTLYDVASNTWSVYTARDGMLGGASGYEPILLGDGTVLTNEGPLDIVAREYATQTINVLPSASRTKLANGNALEVGGLVSTSGAANYIPRGFAFIYDTATGSSARFGSVAHQGSNPVAGRLADGRIVFAGGALFPPNSFGQEIARTAADVYLPGNGSWSEAPALATARTRAASAVLTGGRMLVAGGVTALSIHSTVEYYDLSGSDIVRAAAGSLSGPRYLHTVVALADGSALSIGGRNMFDCACTPFQSTVDRYDPGTNSWSPANPLITGRDSHTALRLDDGRVLVVGGYGGAPNTLADTGSVLASAELFDPVTGNWAATGSLGTARRNHAMIQLDADRILVVGGSDASGTALASAEIYDVNTGVWSPAAAMSAARISPLIAQLPGGGVLVSQGLNGASSAEFGTGAGEVYDPGTDTWSAPVQSVVPRTNGVAVALPDGRVMFVGGLPTQAGTPEFYR